MSTLTRDHENRITDYTAVAVQEEPHYIVRRLMPVECARLQGFPDNWGAPDVKADFTDAEYTEWLKIRNTYERINGKTVKHYTKEQMLKWYNGLHSDSNEYKMFGNGITLQIPQWILKRVVEENEHVQSSDK